MKIWVFAFAFLLFCSFGSAAVDSKYLILDGFDNVVCDEDSFESGPNAGIVNSYKNEFDSDFNFLDGEYISCVRNDNSNLTVRVAVLKYEDSLSSSAFYDGIWRDFITAPNGAECDLAYSKAGKICFGADYHEFVALWISNKYFIIASVYDRGGYYVGQEDFKSRYMDGFLEDYELKYPSTLGESTNVYECIDTDNGLNPLISGEAYIDGLGGLGDYCNSDSAVEEAYCNSKNVYVKKLIDCPSNAPYCSAGACVAEMEFCEETDSGMDPSTLGTTYPKHIADHPGNIDYCQLYSEGDTNEPDPAENGCSGENCGLREFYCIEDSIESSFRDVLCSEGCSNGVCETWEELSSTGVDTEDVEVLDGDVVVEDDDIEGDDVWCKDSDGGEDYFTAGHVSSDENSYEGDFCRYGHLTEYYCSEEKISSVEIECEYGCSVEDEGSCSEYSRGPNYINVVGQLVDQLTHKPIAGASLGSAYEFSPDNVVTDSMGNFNFTFRDDFILAKGDKKGKGDFGAQWSFLADCYDYVTFYSNRNNLGDGKLGFFLDGFDGGDYSWDLGDLDDGVVNVGQIEDYPFADIKIQSDIEASFDIMYELKNESGFNGGGNSNFRTEHYSSNALPLDYDVHIVFTDRNGQKHKSSVYRTPMDAYCGVVYLSYFNGESKWSLIPKAVPSEEDGPVEIEFPKEVIDEEGNVDKNFIDGIKEQVCMGCFEGKMCYPLSYRKEGAYCSEDMEFVDYKLSGVACENNFECDSNLCVNNECLSGSIWAKFMRFLEKIFG